MKWLTSVVVAVFLAGVACDDRTILNAVFREMFLNSTGDICPTCAQKKFALESILSESEIKKYRVDLIKKTILENLGLDKPPVIASHQWPKPVKSGSFYDQSPKKKYFESEQNSIQKLVIMPQVISCQVDDLMEIEELSLKMKYIFPQAIDPKDILSVKLWLDFAQGMEKPMNENEPQAFYMEVIPCGDQTNEHTTTFRGFQSFNEEWIELDAMPVLKSWLERRQKCFNILLTMKNLSHDYCKTIQIAEHNPFLTVQHKSDDQASQSRLKRSRNCSKSSSECCRENLYVSFAEIGWDSWIIFPPGYEAYYCKGSCNDPSSLTLSANGHNSVIQRLLGKRKDITPCCAPTVMSSMEFIVSFGNGSAKFYTIQNSVVDACGCL